MNVLQQLSGELAGVADGIRPHLLQIRNGQRSGGAGVIVREDGLIVTNAHVVASSLRRRRHPTVVLSDGQQLSGRVVAFNRHSDLVGDNREELVPDLSDFATVHTPNMGDGFRID